MRPYAFLTTLTAVLLITLPCHAHFGMLLPEQPFVDQHHRQTQLNLSFSHPYAIVGMDMQIPAKFFVDLGGEQTDLLPSLTETKIMDHRGWQAQYRFQRPGVYYFAMEPKPYWEPAEDVHIIHYTKTAVAAFGDDADWDRPLGLPTEIIPLLRPFGNFAGNSFVGQVLLDGKPVADAEVEVERYNHDGHLALPSVHHETQVIKTDDRGIFTFTCPLEGWWGFAALNSADYTLKGPDGKEKGVELGAVFWVYFDSWRNK